VTDVAELTLAERVAALEAIVAPRATVPPITIGALTNVPVPGSQLAAQWAADASGMVVHRFATTAALKAWSSAQNGTFAVAVDTGVLYRRTAGGWAQQTPWTATHTGIAAQYNGVAAVAINTLVVPADPGPRVMHASCFVRVERVPQTEQASVRLSVNGSSVAQADLYTVPSTTSGIQAFNIYLSAGDIAVAPGATAQLDVQCFASGASGAYQWVVVANASYNRLDALLTPRGY
jgi:hypothetical protein